MGSPSSRPGKSEIAPPAYSCSTATWRCWPAHIDAESRDRWTEERPSPSHSLLGFPPKLIRLHSTIVFAFLLSKSSIPYKLHHELVTRGSWLAIRCQFLKPYLTAGSEWKNSRWSGCRIAAECKPSGCSSLYHQEIWRLFQFREVELVAAHQELLQRCGPEGFLGAEHDLWRPALHRPISFGYIFALHTFIFLDTVGHFQLWKSDPKPECLLLMVDCYFALFSENLKPGWSHWTSKWVGWASGLRLLHQNQAMADMFWYTGDVHQRAPWICFSQCRGLSDERPSSGLLGLDFTLNSRIPVLPNHSSRTHWSTS